MPTNRRRRARSAYSAAEAAAWEMVFISGVDYFRELPGIGVTVDASGRPDRQVAADAWDRLGERFLAGYADPAGRKCWAEREFE